MKRLTLQSFLKPLLEFRNKGTPGDYLRLLPGPVRKMAEGISEAEIAEQLDAAELFLAALTPRERKDPDVELDGPRRWRIARKAEITLSDVETLISAFEAVRGDENG